MREIRIALLEADVHFKVVKEFVSRVKERALGQEVLRNLMPGQQVVKIVLDELVKLFGREEADLSFSKLSPSVILLVGLHGSGKTTTTGKLALWLKKKGHQPLMVSTDMHRPAAIEQLSVIASEIEIGVYEDKGSDAVERAKKALEHTRNTGFDILLIDIAGRLHSDADLMTELGRMAEAVNPTEVLLVADAMTGQDAVNSAREFNQCLNLS